MSEVDRPSANQEAVRAAQIADQRKTKQSEKTATQYGSQRGVAAEGKKISSAFDDVLKNVSEQGAPAFAQDAKFDSRLKEIQGDQEHSSDREDKEEDKKDTKKSEASRETKETSQTGREKVLAKQGSGEQKQDSGGGSGEQKEGKSGQGFQQKSQSAQNFMELKKNQPAPAPGPEMQRLGQPSTELVGSTQTTRELPKAVLDQIVQYVRIGLNKDLNKEIQIDFHDQFFNGLKLKVTSHGKEVSVEFIAQNRSVKDCFQQERENIALALGEKGIDVRSITVTMK
jgi:hypothetical protein